MRKIRCVISVYGNRFFKYLLTCLYSVAKSNPGADVSVMYQEMDEKHIGTLKMIYPHYDFIETHQVLKKDPRKRIPQKLKLWNQACQKYKGENLVFLDVDMVAIKDLSKFFNEEFDIAFTYKNERFPLNTGLVLVKNSKKAQDFLVYWTEEINKMLKDFRLIRLADKKSGSVDQQTLRDIINSDSNFDGKIVRKINSQNIVFFGIPCELLNETRSKKITKNTHIIHYKGAWQPIILDNAGFSRKRPREKSQEMFDCFNEHFLPAKKEFEKIGKTKLMFESKSSFHRKMKNIKRILFSAAPRKAKNTMIDVINWATPPR